MDLDKAIKQRKSIKRYSEKKPDWRDILKAIDLVRFAPMAGNIFSMKFILVQNKEIIEKLAEYSQQDFVKKASYVVVAVSNVNQVKKSYDDKGERFCHQQAGAAIQNFLLKCTDLGLATCWVGYYEEKDVKNVLRIPDEMVVEAFFPIGLETKIKTSNKMKADLDNFIYFDVWEQKTSVKKEKGSSDII